VPKSTMILGFIRP